MRFRDNTNYAVGYQSGLIELRNVEEKTITESISAHASKVTDIRFNVQLNQMATSSLDGFVKIWNSEDFSEPPIALDDNDGMVYTLAFSPDGKSLVTGSQGNDGGRNIIARSTHVDYMAENMCHLISRNFTEEEWWRYIGRDIEYEETCNAVDLRINVRQIKGD